MVAAAAAAVVAVSNERDRNDRTRSWQAAWEARQAQEAERREAERIRRDYERRRAIAHARMRSQPSTIYPSSPPAGVMCPVASSPEVRRKFQLEARQRREAAFRRATGLPLQMGYSVHPVPKRSRNTFAAGGSLAMADSLHVVSTAVAAAPASSASEPGHRVPLFPSASDESGRQGFARVINHSDEAGEATIAAFDDEGTSYGPLTLSIRATETIHFNSADLEDGNAGKGLAGGTGPGQGDWRLEVDSDLDIEVLSYIRTGDGFLTAMHDTAPAEDGRHDVAVFNPGSNRNQESRLRLVNPGDGEATAAIAGVDDRGVSVQGATVTIPAYASRTYTAAELEGGGAAGLAGSIGDGTGKWRLVIESEQDIVAMSLLSSPTGHLTNLSTAPYSEAGGIHAVPLFPSASDANGRQGFVRVVNRSDEAGEVTIQAFDDTDVEYDALALAIGANEAAHFNSDDLELGNADKGLTGSTGAGEGDWRLEFASELDIQVLSYTRTGDGFLTAMHDTAPRSAKRHRVAVFNPGSNRNQKSLLRLVNAGGEEAEVTIAGFDGNGESPGSDVVVSVPAGGSTTLTAQDLEAGSPDFEGALGEGAGKWSLTITADRAIAAMSLLSSPTGHLTNLSTAPQRGAGPVETAAEAFEVLISPIVQETCIGCHVEGGQSGHTPLVFVRDTDADHLAKNLRMFEDYVANEEDGAAAILDKIRGARGHGGLDPVPAGTVGYRGFERFLELLGAEIEGPAYADLFEGVTLQSSRRSLWRAAIVFAGRTPTDEEYADVEGGTNDDLRQAIRAVMEGPGFHEFLIRASNDRLLTDRVLGSNHDPIAVNGYFVSFFREFTKLERDAESSDDAWIEFNDWAAHTQYGAGRAPLELIARVVEKDLPYTQILTADYIMANPWAAEAYVDDSVEFTDDADVHEFRPARIRGYYRKGDTYPEYYPSCGVAEDSPPECDDVLETDWPHAGVLNTLAFLQRYPTTATNRNRARSRWTYYYFLGDDIEKSAARTMKQEVLEDRNNPTLKNEACTVCHQRMDPVAGAFQNYGDSGLYRDQPGGLDSLASTFKRGLANQQFFSVEARSWDHREKFTRTGVWLDEGEHDVAFATRSAHNIIVDHLTVTGSDGEFSRRYELEVVENERCGSAWTGMGFEVVHCPVAVTIEVPSDGEYELETEAYVFHDYAEVQDQPATLSMIVPYYYRYLDTWYRDMRKPGFVDEAGSLHLVPDERNDASLQWLTERIVEDRRFATSAVEFWWPSIMGSEVAEQPEEPSDPEYDARRLAADAQAEAVRRLADGFRQGFGWSGKGPYNLKDLLVEVVMTKWFRAGSYADIDPIRTAALREAGARRLLSPEELARKTDSLTGYQWERGTEMYHPRPHTDGYGALTDEAKYRLFYGGIDSDGITDRARDLTSVMAGVAQRHAVESSCPIVFKEFFLLPDGKRRLFAGVDTSTTPDTEAGAQAIKDKIAELYRKLLGIDADADSHEARTGYDLFLEIWQRKRDPEILPFLHAVNCDRWGDHRYYDGIVDGAVVTIVEGSLRFEHWDYDLVNEFLRGVDDEDPNGVARTWVVMLAYLLMDYRYLYL